MQGKLGQPMGKFRHNAQHMAYSQNWKICPVVEQLKNFAGCLCGPHIFVHIFLIFWSLGNRLAKQQCQKFKGHCLPFGYLGTPRGVVHHHPRGVSRSVPVPVWKQRRWGKIGAQLTLRGQLLEDSCSARHHRWSNHLNTQHLGMRGCCPLAGTLRIYYNI